MKNVYRWRPTATVIKRRKETSSMQRMAYEANLLGVKLSVKDISMIEAGEAWRLGADKVLTYFDLLDMRLVPDMQTNKTAKRRKNSYIQHYSDQLKYVEQKRERIIAELGKPGKIHLGPWSALGQPGEGSVSLTIEEDDEAGMLLLRTVREAMLNYLDVRERDIKGALRAMK